jgi:hypothetical protein
MNYTSTKWIIIGHVKVSDVGEKENTVKNVNSLHIKFNAAPTKHQQFA